MDHVCLELRVLLASVSEYLGYRHATTAALEYFLYSLEGRAEM